jgi:hypothetical protein
MVAEDHVTHNMVTYNAIAQHSSDRDAEFAGVERSLDATLRRLACQANVMLVPACDDGRDSHDLAMFGLSLTSFDLSDAMLAIACCQDPGGDHRLLDLRDLARLDGTYDGIWASDCLTKPEFARCVEDRPAPLARTICSP